MTQVTTSEKLTLALGLIAFLPLLGAVITLNDDLTGFADVAAILLILIHLIVLLVALPFLIRSTRQEVNHSRFQFIVGTISVLNALLIILALLSLPQPTDTAFVVFLVIAVLDLLPLFLFKLW